MNPNSIKKISKEDKARVKDAQSGFSIMTLTSFNLHSSKGLLTLANELIRIGATYGLVKAENVLNGKTTIARDCYEKGAQCP